MKKSIFFVIVAIVVAVVFSACSKGGVSENVRGLINNNEENKDEVRSNAKSVNSLPADLQEFIDIFDQKIRKESIFAPEGGIYKGYKVDGNDIIFMVMVLTSHHDEFVDVKNSINQQKYSNEVRSNFKNGSYREKRLASLLRKYKYNYVMCIIDEKTGDEAKLIFSWKDVPEDFDDEYNW